MAQDIVNNDLLVTGTAIVGSLNVQSAAITNSMVSASAAIAASKLEHQHAIEYGQATGSAVVNATQGLHIARATGTVVAFEAAIIGAIATGNDRTCNIDLQKSTSAGAFATVLSAAISFNNTSTIRTLTSASFSNTSYVDGDLYQVVVAVAGANGNQAQGLMVTLTVREGP